jgi:hypothetical protein
VQAREKREKEGREKTPKPNRKMCTWNTRHAGPT